tara:strand:- start:34 stop:540 length:507 start_codon:yes stop_codon:yes gene_type:complete
MKFLNLIRHGNAEINHKKNDFDRELDSNGNSDLDYLDKFLYRYSFKKHKILCSASLRTIQTLNSLKFSLNEDSRVEIEDSLYLANMKTIWDLIYKNKKSYMISIIGHNPGLSDILSFFTGNFELPDLKTSTIAQIFFKDSDLSNEGAGELKFMVQSKNNDIISLSSEI